MVDYKMKRRESWIGIYFEEENGRRVKPGQRDICDQTLLDTCMKVSKKRKN